MIELNRRDLLVLLPAVALGKVPLRCCDSEPLSTSGIAFTKEKISIDVRVVRRTGVAYKIVDAERKVNLILAHPEKDRYVALERLCTHGGGPVAYNFDKRTVQCTCWGQSEFDMEGKVLFGPAKKPLRVYPVAVVGRTLEIRL